MGDPSFLPYPRPARRVVVGLDDLAADVGGADVLGAREGVAALAQFIREVVREGVWKWSRVNLRTDAINFTEKFADPKSHPSFTLQGEANLDVLRFVIQTRGNTQLCLSVT